MQGIMSADPGMENVLELPFSLNHLVVTISFISMSRHVVKLLLRLDSGQAVRHECTILLLRQNKLVCILGC